MTSCWSAPGRSSPPTASSSTVDRMSRRRCSPAKAHRCRAARARWCSPVRSTAVMRWSCGSSPRARIPGLPRSCGSPSGPAGVRPNGGAAGRSRGGGFRRRVAGAGDRHRAGLVAGRSRPRAWRSRSRCSSSRVRARWRSRRRRRSPPRPARSPVAVWFWRAQMRWRRWRASRTSSLTRPGRCPRGECAWSNASLCEGADRGAALALAAALEARSEHPLARAVVAAAPDGAEIQADHREHAAGRGIEARIGGNVMRIGRLDFVAELAGHMPAELGARSTAAWPRTAWPGWASDAGWIAVLVFADALRSGSQPLVAALRDAGIVPVLLSGDRAQNVTAVASALGIADANAAMLPEDKRDAIARLQAEAPSSRWSATASTTRRRLRRRRCR